MLFQYNIHFLGSLPLMQSHISIYCMTHQDFAILKCYFMQVVEALIRRIPQGQQVKREVDFILDQCSDTMTPMHYHIREVIFVTFNKVPI